METFVVTLNSLNKLMKEGGKEMSNLMVCTNWEKVEKDDFYLTSDWDGEGKEKAIKLQKEDNLYYAYYADAKELCKYKILDMNQIFINEDEEIIMNCEYAPENNDFTDKWDYDD
jgi:hypothetical protein